MSEFANVPVGKQAQDMDISPVFRPYSGVEIIVSEDTAYFAGDRSGRVLQIENPWGTQAQANNILASLVQSGFQYQPYTASNALVNPAAELGDAVTVNGTYSGIYKMSRNYSSLMAADIEAPQDEAIDHEFPYEPKQDRIYKREIADAQAQIRINHDSIESEVIRATSAEGTLRSSISQNARDITAKVSSSGGNNSSFAWSLDANGFTLTSSNTQVFKCTSSGVEISGKITAKTGYIGNGSSGFTIGSTNIRNGMTSLSDKSHNGIYIGTDGIAMGKGAFKVTSSGNVTANNLTANNAVLTGTLNIGGTDITAAALRSGAASAYGWTTKKDSSGTTQVGRWTSGAAGGITFTNSTVKNANGPTYFNCGIIRSTTGQFVDGANGITFTAKFSNTLGGWYLGSGGEG